MKINLLFVACIFFFSSCTRNIQVLKVDSSDVQLFNEDIFAAENEELAVAYDFWIEGGVTVFNVTNKTDQAIIVDFTESTFKINEQLFFYYQDLYRYFDLTGVPVDPKEIRIEPNGTETIEGFPITYQWRPVSSSSAKFYAPKNSPIRFVNKLSYHFADNENEELFFENEFWVSSIEKLKRKEYRALAQGAAPKSDKFYVRRNQAQTVESPSFWVSVGIELLALFLFL